MAEITTHAYQNIRDYIKSNWNNIELQDENSTPIIRISQNDERVTVSTENNLVKITLVVKGSDSDINLPSTLAKSLIYNVSNGGNAFSEETFSPFTIENDQDKLTVIHTIEVPRV